METSCLKPRIYDYSFSDSSRFDETDNMSEPVKSPLVFKTIEESDMGIIWEYLKKEKGRTTDFSYGGVLMWVKYFHYEYCIFENTLFIKGRIENSIDETAYSMPIGELSLDSAVEYLKLHCRLNNERLAFSAVPEYGLADFIDLNPESYEELVDWADYLYDLESLATLKGKKFNKKRNHVNQFVAKYDNWSLEQIDDTNYREALEFMDRFDTQGDNTPLAIKEREYSRDMIRFVGNKDAKLIGALLKIDGETAAYTIGDIKGDTLYIHVEKALNEYAGSYEMINKCFAEHVMNTYPEVKFVNREDDAGDEGLRQAKESYRPVDVLKKYNIRF